MGNGKLLCRKVTVTERPSESHILLTALQAEKLMKEQQWGMYFYDERGSHSSADPLADLQRRSPYQSYIQRHAKGPKICWDGNSFIAIFPPRYRRDLPYPRQFALGAIEIELTLRPRELPLLAGLLGPLAALGFVPRDEQVYRDIPLMQREVAWLLFSYVGYDYRIYPLDGLSLIGDGMDMHIGINNASKWFISRPDAIKRLGKGRPSCCVRLTIHNFDTTAEEFRGEKMLYLPDPVLARQTAERIADFYRQLTV